MSAYLRYIVQREQSSFLYDKYQNQSIAAHVMRASLLSSRSTARTTARYLRGF